MVFDSTAEALAVQRHVWHRQGPASRVRTAIAVSEEIHRVALAGLAARHPELDRGELVRLLIARTHGIDVLATGG